MSYLSFIYYTKHLFAKSFNCTEQKIVKINEIV